MSGGMDAIRIPSGVFGQRVAKASRWLNTTANKMRTGGEPERVRDEQHVRRARKTSIFNAVNQPGRKAGITIA